MAGFEGTEGAPWLLFDLLRTASLNRYDLLLSDSESPNLLRRIVAIGDATKREENVPMIRPISNASANSLRVTAPIMPEPTTRTETTGRIDVILVFTDRMKT